MDWFNPFGNKILGRKTSVGVSALMCLDLPPSIRHQSWYTFLAGIIPGPKEPSMLTISNILKPLIDELVALNDGIRMPTYKFGNGRRIWARLGALIGDVVATHKVSGFASHSATRFCLWCYCKKDEIPLLAIGNLWVGWTTIQQSIHWKDLSTSAARERYV